jgi:hypothetical protein
MLSPYPNISADVVVTTPGTNYTDNSNLFSLQHLVLPPPGELPNLRLQQLKMAITITHNLPQYLVDLLVVTVVPIIEQTSITIFSVLPVTSHKIINNTSFVIYSDLDLGNYTTFSFSFPFPFLLLLLLPLSCFVAADFCRMFPSASILGWCFVREQ